MNDNVNLGPIRKLIEDPEISEIMINGPYNIFAEKNGRKIRTDVAFANEEEVFKFIRAIYSARGKRVDKDVPYADVCLEDGTRINVIIPPVSRFGVCATLRKFSKAINTLDDLIKLGTLNKKAADLLIACIKGKVNMIFSGGTGVGKTTILQTLSNYFAPEERVITVEDAAELKVVQKNTISLETTTSGADGQKEVTLRELIRNALRMAPDRIVVGEVR
ncbi:MAG: ATPase, T2SS/T4P/T4SS family, partial [Candidatus Omnitrophica bacterium]|nr:ATPase, T2SS/T4P/T4SS family [Candidatus Omnitrophota bacterium]